MALKLPDKPLRGDTITDLSGRVMLVDKVFNDGHEECVLAVGLDNAAGTVPFSRITRTGPNQFRIFNPAHDTTQGENSTVTTTREARHLNGADLGKTVTIDLGEHTVTGHLTSVGHQANLINDERLCTTVPRYEIGPGKTIFEILVTTGILQTTLEPTHPVTITGTPTPAGLNLHKSVLDQDG